MTQSIKRESTVDSDSRAPLHWAESNTSRECSLHQLSPYIGKLKSTIARDLIQQYSCPGQLVVDMFCGSGTVPLEAARLGRRVFASDSSKYAVVLTKGKLQAPNNLSDAHSDLEHLLARSESMKMPDLRSIPKWIRAFFHPRTLKEVLRITELFKKERRYFYMASLLGILHHQRPGFLSYPSSHLVPYLRTRNFPKSKFPELYEYRPVRPRLQAKVKRALNRSPESSLNSLIEGIRKSSAESINLPTGIDFVLTSPPYMNALDYRRDNRLRLWFLGEPIVRTGDYAQNSPATFKRLINTLARQLNKKVKFGGYCIFIVGEQSFRGSGCLPSESLINCFLSEAKAFRLHMVIDDVIPDIRRSRKNYAGVKKEHFLVFRKEWYA